MGFSSELLFVFIVICGLDQRLFSGYCCLHLGFQGNYSFFTLNKGDKKAIKLKMSVAGNNIIDVIWSHAGTNRRDHVIICNHPPTSVLLLKTHSKHIFITYSVIIVLF